MNKSQYMPQLDGLRAIAVAAVIYSHAVKGDLCEAGATGVRLFYVLSGFLITGILLKARESADRNQVFRAFYCRRFLRIFPAYYAVIGVMLALGVLAATSQLWWHLLYASNILFALKGEWEPRNTAHFWSLAVEEQFYLFWPAIILLTPKRWLLTVMASCIVLAPLFRLAVYAITGNQISANVLVFSCMDCLGAGGLLAWFSVEGFPPWSRSSIRLLVGAAFVGMVATIAYHSTGLAGCNLQHVLFYSLFCAVFFAWMVARAAEGFSGIVGWGLSNPFVRYVGRISYGIYVYHLIVMMAVRKTGVEGDGWVVLLTSLGTIGVASVSWFLMEKPLNDLKRYFPYVRPIITSSESLDLEREASVRRQLVHTE